MPIPTKPHPGFNSVRLQPTESAEVHAALMRFRNKALETNVNASGMPPGFKEWAANHLRQIAHGNPYYAGQVKALVHKAQQDVAKLEKERNDVAAAFDLRIEELTSELDQLLDALPVEVES
jgi:hypothetical protein